MYFVFIFLDSINTHYLQVGNSDAPLSETHTLVRIRLHAGDRRGGVAGGGGAVLRVRIFKFKHSTNFFAAFGRNIRGLLTAAPRPTVILSSACPVRPRRGAAT